MLTCSPLVQVISSTDGSLMDVVELTKPVDRGKARQATS